MNFHGGNIYDLNREVLDFSSNINPLGVPETFKKRLEENLDAFTKYPDVQYLELRKSIVEYLGVDSIDYIVPGNGAVEIIYKVVESLKVKEVIIAAPTFSEYRRAANLNGISFEEIKAYDEKDNSLLMARFLNGLKPNSLYVLCNPNNPSGSYTDTEVIGLMASILREVNSYLLLDEAFIEFCDDYPNSSFVSNITEHSNVIVIRAATKFFGMPGIRLGYAVSSNKKIISEIRDKLDPWNVNTAAVLAGLSIFKDQDYIAKSREWLCKERFWLYCELKNLSGLIVYPTRANFFLAKLLKHNLNGDTLKKILIDNGILIRTAEGFTHLDDNYIRVAIKDREANEKLIEVLKKI